MKDYYKIPVELLAMVTAVVFFATIDEFANGSYVYASVGVLTFLGLIFYTFFNVKD